MNGKRLVWAIGLSVLWLIVGSWLVYGRYQTGLTAVHDEAVRNGQSVGQTLAQAVRDSMTNNSHDQMRQQTVATLGPLGVVQIRILGLNGKVYADSHQQLQGESLDKGLPGCYVCHRNTPTPTVTAVPLSPNRLRIATDLPNESTCNSCHNVPNAPSLGVVLVDVSLADPANALWHQLEWQWGVVVVLAFFIAGGIARPKLRPMHHWSLKPLTLALLVGTGLFFVGNGLVLSHVEENNAFCTSCHTEPETIYYQRTVTHSVDSATDLATAHALQDVPCIACHSGAGVAGRTVALAQGAKNAALFVSGQYESPARPATGMDQAHCTKCHSDWLGEYHPDDHFHYLASASSDPTTSCVACHTAHPDGRSAEQGYRDSETVKAVCVACHTAVTR